MNKYMTQLQAVFNNKNSSVCFLSVDGGIGKSGVIYTMIHYSKLLYNELGIRFTKKTIALFFINGSAAISIQRETMYSSCKSNVNLVTDNDWNNTKMIVADEMSSIRRPDFARLDKVLNAKKWCS